MGVLNPRAICPSCGAKIHTQSKMIRNPLRHRGQVTGTTCPQCGVALTGNVGAWNNKAELARPENDKRPRP